MSFLLWHYLRDSAARDPDHLAVVSQDASLTYGQLELESDRIARQLTDADLGVGSRIGLLLPKSERAVAAMLGVLKAGATYVPVDPTAPPRRGGYILRDCGVRGLVANDRVLQEYAEAGIELPDVELAITTDSLPDRSGTPFVRIGWDALPRSGPVRRGAAAVETDPAYLLYTSGSTGQPKGVILSHRHARTFVDWATATFDIEAGDRLANHAPFHFDLSVFDIYAALSSGASVHLVPDRLSAFPLELCRWVDMEQISVWYSVPSALVRMLLHGKLERFTYDRLRAILFAGEVFPVKYLRQLMAMLPRAAFYNLYGPTETNVCTWYRVPPDISDATLEIPIGLACANTDVFALDEHKRRVHPGGTGELYVRGPAVMLGYWGLPDRTRDSLLPNPLQPAYHDPVYRTGDVVRLGLDDNYYFCGRQDHMVKSRGYRIELGEIEQALHAHELVKEAVIVAVSDEEVGARLFAFVAPVSGGEVADQQLQAFCADRLPRYMVPEKFILRSELPKTSTGKIDRQSLQNDLSSNR